MPANAGIQPLPVIQSQNLYFAVPLDASLRWHDKVKDFEFV
jgi:hypothetical protein